MSFTPDLHSKQAEISTPYYLATFNNPTVVMSIKVKDCSMQSTRFADFQAGIMFPVQKDNSILISAFQFDKIMAIISMELQRFVKDGFDNNNLPQKQVEIEPQPVNVESDSIQKLLPVIKTQIGEEEIFSVDARLLHQFLDVKKQFTDWIKPKIREYGFVENSDFYPSRCNAENGREMETYMLTIDMAKELSMISKTARGKQARQYFIKMEKVAKEMVQPPQSQPLPAVVPVSQPIQVNGQQLSTLEVLQIAVDAEKARITAEQDIKQLEDLTKKNEPKVEAFNQFISNDEVYTLRGAFKMLGLPPNISTAKLREDGILYYLQEVLTPYQQYIDRGYFVVRPNHNTVDNKDYPQTYVTAKGVDWLRKRYSKK